MTNVSSKREVPNEILSREEEVKKDDASNDAAPSEDSRVDSPPTDCVPMEVVEIKPSAEAKSSSTSALVNNPMANVFTNPMLKTFDNPIAKAFDNPMTKAFDNSITKLAFPSFGNVEVIPIELNSKHAFTTLHEIGHLKASLESLKHLPQSLTTTTPPPQLTVLQQTVKTAKKSRDEEREKEVLKLKLDQLQSKLLEKDAEIAERIKNLDMKDGQVAELEQKVAELEAYEKERQQLKRLLTLHNRVNQIAQDHLRREGSALEKGYISALEEHVEAFVVSIDIRKSTELMLRAKQPELFAKFITELTGALRTAVTERFGVFDKFTGDGILAFFPYFFCGADAGLMAVDASEECHRQFAAIFEKHHASFYSVPLDAGLGIGIDFGSVKMISFEESLTVVGVPVVYACRMGAAPATQTLLNVPAFSQLKHYVNAYLKVESTEVVFKNEGRMKAYAVRRNGSSISKVSPPWMT